MLLKIRYIVILFVVLSCAKPPTQPANPRIINTPVATPAPDPVVVTLGQKKLTKNDLIISLENSTTLDSGSTDQILKELIERKLFVAEARSQGMDTVQNFKEQMESNASMAVQSALEDKTAITKLGNEAYDRYLKEINASHIFIPLSAYASPADSLKLYKELLNIRDLAIKNNDFETQAKRWSKDPKTAANGGSLGWFSVFNLVYPLETAVYSIPKDSISKPVRSTMGYHIIKVNDVRKNSGAVKVQHIWKAVPKDMSPQNINKLYSLLDSVRTEIVNKGAKFEDMVTRFSDDFGSRDVGGELPPFGIGTRQEAAFEDVAFALKPGEISKPFQSTSGLHIIRLIEKYKPETKTKFLDLNSNKLITDSRADFLTQKRINDLKKKYNVQIKNDVQDNALKFASVKILGRNWVKPSTVILNDILFTINEKPYSVKNFYEFIEDRQQFERWPSENPSEIFTMLYERFLGNSLIKYQEEASLKQNADLLRWVEAQEENILYTTFLDDNIIRKSLTDTVGQKLFYERNKAMFQINEIGTMTVTSFANEDVYKSFKELTKEPKPYRLYRGITPILFEENEYKITQQDERKLFSLKQILEANEGYIVEVGGNTDAKEDEQISELRIREVVNYLVKIGVPLKRISEVNYKNSVVRDRFDWSKNQAVSFEFYSNLESDLVKTFNSKNENAITFDSFKINRKDFESKMNTAWGNKTGTVRVDGKIEEYILKVKKIKGTYLDAKTDVIIKYQEYLKDDLVKKLRAKYNVSYNSSEINTIINDLKRSK